MDNKPKKIYIWTAGVLAVAVLFLGWIALKINDDKIVKNTYINETNIGELTTESAKEKLKKDYKSDNINVKYFDKMWNIKGNDIDLYYDIDQTVKKAYNIKKSNSFFKNAKMILSSMFGQKNNLDINVNYDLEKLKKEISKIATKINVDVKNASVNINNSVINIEEGNSGLELNTDESIKNILNQIKKGSTEVELVVTKIEQDIKKEHLQNIDTRLASYSTSFNSSIYGRTTNIKLATNRTSDVLLMPGEVFSFNEKTEMRTLANGYKNAPVIVQGVVQEGIGGGVCQVSSTLYNTVLYSGLEIVNVKNHSIPSTYVKKGRDATVTDSGIDFVFKNNLNYPVYIKNYVSGNTVTCQIYGSKKDKKNIEISTNIDGVSVAPIKKVDDPTMLVGKEKELEAGRNGYTVSTYRIYKDNNGEVIKTEKIATSYYPKKQGILAVGTMEKEVEPEIPNPEPEIPNPEPEPEIPNPEPEPEIPNPDPEIPNTQPEQ